MSSRPKIESALQPIGWTETNPAALEDKIEGRLSKRREAEFANESSF